ncbi:hypothetical protein H4219_004786 [Mycoemilia scoparia]|uniref:Uncharacterized protein n=1 Tax=Mycoemilia scoparia TaxID=417184 RepID=A0A9W7ZX47_9FUNG|nr:hypothetical protein H4219_004786 [Mycoemilia scoparia]
MPFTLGASNTFKKDECCTTQGEGYKGCANTGADNTAFLLCQNDRFIEMNCPSGTKCIDTTTGQIHCSPIQASGDNNIDEEDCDGSESKNPEGTYEPTEADTAELIKQCYDEGKDDCGDGGYGPGDNTDSDSDSDIDSDVDDDSDCDE